MQLSKWQFYAKTDLNVGIVTTVCLIFGISTIEINITIIQEIIIIGMLFFSFIILFGVKSIAFKEIRKGDSLSNNQY